MKIVVQRALDAKCVVNSECVGSIDRGLLLLVGFTDGDSLEDIQYFCKKIVNLRIFDDENGIMNKSILDVGGKVLSISQFTLYGDASKGNRPSYIRAMKHEHANEMYNTFNKELRKYISVEEGVFGGDMQITFTNSGPVTIILER